MPSAVSLAATASLLVFSQYASAVHIPWPAADPTRLAALGAESRLGQAAGRELGEIIGAACRAAARHDILVAAWALALPTVPHGVVCLGLAAVVVALAVELTAQLLQPGRSGWRLTSFAAASGLLLTAGYVAAVAVTDELAWPVEVWSGAALSSAGLGLLLAYLAGAPAGKRKLRSDGVWSCSQVPQS